MQIVIFVLFRKAQILTYYSDCSQDIFIYIFNISLSNINENFSGLLRAEISVEIICIMTVHVILQQLSEKLFLKKKSYFAFDPI